MLIWSVIVAANAQIYVTQYNFKIFKKAVS